MVTQNSIEIRLRRAAIRQNLRIEKCKMRDPMAIGFNMWRIVDRRGRLVAGGKDANGYSLTLEEVAEFLGRPLYTNEEG